MEQATTRSGRLGDVRREVNALLGLLSYSAERCYPDAIRDSLRALLQARVEELQKQGKRS
jgi:hypothetical protein